MKKTILNIIRKIYPLVTACVVVFMISPVTCYCGYESVPFVDVIIKCSESWEEAPWHRYDGEPGVKQTLKTTGIKDRGKTKYKFGNDFLVSVLATCMPPEYEGDIVDLMGSDDGSDETIYTQMWPEEEGEILQQKVLACEAGWGIAVKMEVPNDNDPNRYKYIGKIEKETVGFSFGDE
ncbi:MAG: hypothetical protein ACD_21C00292G0002 [uncultured bacterium]|nr:MAG: hypothetical protein ACD_21C00292G0002 [uncultured bacterium]